MSKDSTDELFDIKTAYYLGNYQQAINEAQKLKVFFREKKRKIVVYNFKDRFLSIFVFQG